MLRGSVVRHHRTVDAISRSRSTFVPPATWSIAKLGLHQQHESAAIDMDALCRRACLEPQPGLRQDVANMMHMLQQVTAAGPSELSTADIYDRPRGVTAAPVLEGPSEAVKGEESMEWLDTLRNTTMKRVGGHYYFELDTSNSSEKDDSSTSD